MEEYNLPLNNAKGSIPSINNTTDNISINETNNILPNEEIKESVKSTKKNNKSFNIFSILLIILIIIIIVLLAIYLPRYLENKEYVVNCSYRVSAKRYSITDAYKAQIEYANKDENRNFDEMTMLAIGMILVIINFTIDLAMEKAFI